MILKDVLCGVEDGVLQLKVNGQEHIASTTFILPK